jgi:hypothetical protein
VSRSFLSKKGIDVSDLREWWPILLSAVAVVVFAVRQEQIGKSLQSKVQGINDRLDALNGKVYKHEGEIAKIKGRCTARVCEE